jgi:hypothetical protein
MPPISRLARKRDEEKKGKSPKIILLLILGIFSAPLPYVALRNGRRSEPQEDVTNHCCNVVALFLCLKLFFIISSINSRLHIKHSFSPCRFKAMDMVCKLLTFLSQRENA